MSSCRTTFTVTMCSVLLRADYVPGKWRISSGVSSLWLISRPGHHFYLLGEAGLVNEPCATFSYHGNSETSRLSPEELLLDGRHMEEMISDLAVKYVGDSEQQRLLQLNAPSVFCTTRLDRSLRLSIKRREDGPIYHLTLEIPQLSDIRRTKSRLTFLRTRPLPSFHCRLFAPAASGARQSSWCENACLSAPVSPIGRHFSRPE